MQSQWNSENMDGTPQISRSGRVLKKSAKVKEMENLDIPDFETQGKSRKKLKSMDDSDEFDDKRVAPIKIPKISIMSTPIKKRVPELSHSFAKMPFPSPVKPTLDSNRPLFRDSSSPEFSRESESSTSSSESSSTSSTSSDDSDGELQNVRHKFSNVEVKPSILQNIQRAPVKQDKVVVEPYRQQFDSPVTFVDHNNDISMDETSESALIIAEESNDSIGLVPKSPKKTISKKKPVKKAPAFNNNRGKIQKKKPANKDGKPVRKKKTEGRSKPLTAYMLWCTENRKQIASSMGNLGFASIGKKMGETWQALSDKDKMAWRRKAKKLALKNSSLINTSPANESTSRALNNSSSSMSDDIYRSLSESSKTGTSPIDVAAYLKLLGESLSVIGQRLTEHEGQLAVSGIFSVLLDSILCVLAPLLCLTSESPVLNSVPQEVCRRILDNIAYFMPGL